VPLREGTTDEVAIAIADPTDSFVLSAVQMAAGKRVRPYIAAPNEIEAALERLYGGGKSTMGTIVEGIQSRDEEQDWGDVEHLKDLASEAPVVRLVNLLLTKALESRASDIHIEPVREPAHRALPHRRRAARGRIAAAAPVGRG